MPRTNDIYALPPGSGVSNGDTSDASNINTPLNDLETEMNAARPIVAGGTGATSVTAALANLGITSSETPESRGAVGDGSADDTTELQAFVTANAGGSIRFGSGKNYKISTQISVPANTIIDMNGCTVTLDSGASRAFLVAGSHVTIKNGKIDCDFKGIGISGANDKDYMVVDNVEILNSSGTGIASTNCSYQRITNCRVYWDSTGVTARVAAGTPLYGITVLVTTDGYVVKRPYVGFNEIDFTAFTASQMESVDACILMRGDEVGGTFTNMINPVAVHNRMLMPEGVRGTTYGSGLPRPTGIEIRTATDMQCHHNYTAGGDLTNTFGRITRGTVSAPHAVNQTHYGIEVAQDCRDIDIVSPTVLSPLGLQLISITDCAGFTITGGYTQGGNTSSSNCVRIEGTDTAGTITGLRVVAGATGSDGIDLASGSQASIVGCEFFSSVSGGGGHIHVSTGTITNLAVSGCTFEGVAVRPIKISGTVTHLRVGLCDGIGSPLASDVTTGTVTASTYTDNHNLTNLV